MELRRRAIPEEFREMMNPKFGPEKCLPIKFSDSEGSCVFAACLQLGTQVIGQLRFGKNLGLNSYF